MDDHDEFARLKAWLPAQDARTWHQVALSWNWDNGTAVLNWILDQPHCDRGTAIALYLMGDPGYYADKFASIDEMRVANHWGLGTAEFLAGISRRWDAGQFPEYRFHPGNWWDRSRLWEEVPPGMISEAAPWPVPASMAAAPLKGEPVDISAFTEGMPNAWLMEGPEPVSPFARLMPFFFRKR